MRTVLYSHDNRHDTGTGRVALKDFLARALPPDFSEQPWNIRRDIEMDQAREHLSKTTNPVPEWPDSLKHNRMSVKQYIALIRQKILERTKRPSDQYREGACASARQLLPCASAGVALLRSRCSVFLLAPRCVLTASVPPVWEPAQRHPGAHVQRTANAQAWDQHRRCDGTPRVLCH